ncbi:MAG: hypothetical protein BWX86_02291 [Verrucomicrobia bacterium ADurb.Bin122]|nr:MAG: hypothetical protein BWX86_02291 [Verrucomicrobia bacterium ADurb.Bin122]
MSNRVPCRKNPMGNSAAVRSPYGGLKCGVIFER